MNRTARSHIPSLATRASAVTLVVAGMLAGCSADLGGAQPSTATSPGGGPGVPTTLVTARTTPSTDPGPTNPQPPNTSDGTGPRIGGFGSARLAFFGDCPELLGYLQAAALERVTAWGLGGGGMYDARAGDDVMESAAEATMAPAAMDDSSAPVAGAVPDAGGGPTYSGTNTQEVGVDEGDMVETNGTHVFVAGQDGVRIVDVASAQVVERVDVPEGSHQLLLDGTRLLVVTQPYTGVEDTITSLFDVTDPDRPELLRRSHLEGRLIASRSIDGQARLVLTSALANRLPFVFPTEFGLDEQRSLEANQAVIRESTIDDWLPRYFDEAGDGTFGAIDTSLDCATVAAPRDFAGLGISWIASLDLRAGTSPVGAAGVVSNGETVYASATSIYLATVPWEWNVDGSQNTQPPTLIHRFDLGDGGAAAYVASGEIEGRLLNQFAMSELNGDLRVASTRDDWSGAGQSESFVHVLRAEGDELVVVGKVGGLGLTEQIYAVRFLGSTAYVVTFRQTDPLYVVDLSDPTNPVVAGELKIPGYSAYLHPVGDGLLLGVGQNADLDGRTSGTQMSLFDVSDPANPRQISTLPIGGYSEAEWDHKAFLYWAADGTIVIPVSPMWDGCGPAVDCLAADVTSQAGGVIVAQLQGRELVGRGVIQHESTSNNGCWNPLQRSMVIDSELVTIGLDQIQFTDRATLTPRDGVSWGNADQYGCAYYMEG